MSKAADRPFRYVIPRPEVVKTLGVLNIVTSIAISMCVSLSMLLFLLVLATTPRTIAVPIPPTTTPVAPSAAPSTTAADGPAGTLPATDGSASPAAPAPTPPPMVGTTISINPFMGTDDPGFVQFCVVDLVTALIINLTLFVSGIGLMRLKRWGMLWSNWTAAIKIARLVILWSGFLFLVAPGLSTAMANSVIKMMPPNAKGPMPDVKMLSNVYLITNAVTAVVVILIGIIYPVIALVIATRPGFRAALRREDSTNPATFPEE